MIGLFDVLDAESPGICSGSPNIKEVTDCQQKLQKILKEPIITEFLEEGDKLLHLPIEIQRYFLKLLLEKYCLYLLLK